MNEELQKLIGAAIAYISIHPRSEAEIRIYLHKRVVKLHMPETAIPMALERLQELRLVDDAAYARMFVESRMRSRPKGERLIRLELKTKGVQPDVIEAVCGKLFEKNSEGSTELNLARRAVEKKWRLWQKLSFMDKKQKIYRYLAARGFSSSVIYNLIDELVGNHYNT
ncbi:MAG: regulatory protein RecX [Candidatus Gottesmanbacteria bacterium]